MFEVTDRCNNGRPQSSTRLPGGSQDVYLQQLGSTGAGIEWDYPITPSNRFLTASAYTPPSMFSEIVNTPRVQAQAHRGGRTVMHQHLNNRRIFSDVVEQQYQAASSHRSIGTAPLDRNSAMMSHDLSFSAMFAGHQISGWEGSYFTESEDGETESVEEDSIPKKSSNTKDSGKQKEESTSKLKSKDKDSATSKEEPEEEIPKGFRWVHIEIV